ncbi:MAG TPA: translation initiation factor [Bacteroidota bacterium]|nr:translation initiation factor [Bacteroidota bacterium]
MKLTSLSDLKFMSGVPDEEIHPQKKSHDGKGAVVQITLETAGRKGKAVTVLSGLHHNPNMMNDIARQLKQECGAGGSVKAGRIEIQGDQRKRVAAMMKNMGYVVNL